MSEPFLELLRKVPAYADRTDLQLELMLPAVPNVERQTGYTAHQHRMRIMRKLYPSRIDHYWRELFFKGFQRARAERRKELMYIGSSNSNKTGSLADLLLELWFENPAATTIYVTSPYETATETGVWARILEQFQEAQGNNPELPGQYRRSDSSIILYERNPLSFIRVTTIDQIGKLVGKKSQSFGAGLIIIAADELPEFKQRGSALKGVMGNLRSVPNLMLIGAGNFADPTDALGQFCTPDREGGYESLDIDVDQEWTTNRKGLVVRFDGEQSPNVRAGEDLYPFVTTIEYLKDLAETSGGKNSPDYLRFGRSFPQLDIEEFTVTNTVKLKAGKVYETVTWTGDEIIEGAHCDPGFGGDPCILQFWKLGNALIAVKDEEGEILEYKTKQIFMLWGLPVTVPIEVGKKDAAGDEITIDNQIALFCKEKCEAKEIPPKHFSFDGSMRASIVQAFLTVWSNDLVAMDYNGNATDRVVSTLNQKLWREEAYNFATEIWLAAASLIQSGQLRGLQQSPAAVAQLCSRRWSWHGKKLKKLQTKKEYKEDNDQKSPNEADALIGGIENARRLGLALNGMSATASSKIREILARMRQQEAMAQLKGGKRKLPSGQLHSISPQGETRKLVNPVSKVLRR